MVKIFDIKSFTEREQFELRLQISLRSNAVNIQKNSKHPERFEEYIRERDQKIKRLLGTTSTFVIKDDNNQIYP